MKNIGIVVLVCAMLLGTSTIAGINTHIFQGFVDMPVESTAVSLEFPTLEVREEGGYVIVDAGSDTLHTLNPSEPMMPYRTEVFTFPLGTVVRDVKVIPSEVKTVQLNEKVMPAANPAAFNMQHTATERYEGDVYARSELYPAAWATWRVGIGLKDNERVVFLVIQTFPARYMPSTNTLLYTNEIDIDIDYELPSEPAPAALDAYDMVIIAPSKFADGLQPLVAHKESHGVATKLVTLEEIYGGTYFSVQGRDDAEKVKYFIKDAIEQWGITYVMLVGGRHGGVAEPKWWCPVRNAWLDVGDSDKYFLSDLYFADIYKYEEGQPVFDDWDSNGNDMFGEWSWRGKDIIDMFPDVYIGRLACRNSYEVGVMVDKIISYETTAYGQAWSNRFVGIGGDTFPGDQWYDGEESVNKAIEYLSALGIEATTLFTSDGTLTEGQDIIDAVSAGCGFLDFEGHGNPMSWANHPPQDGDTWIGIDETQFIFFKNKDMYPVCMIGGCSNSKFDISLLNLLDFKNLSAIWAHSSWGPECFGWWLARKVDGGAITTIGCTSYGYGKSGDTDHDGIFDGIQYRGGFIDIEFFRVYAQEGKDTVGAAHGTAITNYLTKFPPLTNQIDAKTVEEWVLLGDPSLKIGGYP